MDDIIAEFLTETNDGLEALDNSLVLLEQNPNDDALISKIFRVIHTIKGTAGFLGFSRLGLLAHKAEDVLGLFRDKKLAVTPEYVTLIFELIDSIKQIVAGIDQTGQEPQGDDNLLIHLLEDIYAQNQSGGAYRAPAPVISAPAVQSPEPESEPVPEPAQEPDPAPAATSTSAPVPQTPEDHKPASAEGAVAVGGGGGDSMANSSLRVSVDVLENLMTMVSELVLNRNQLLQILRQNNNSDFAEPLQNLNLVVSDLQEGVMKTRMQPVGNAWSKLPRIIRDVCNELGKKINLEMHGQETELDRQVLEVIKDPLMHMVRNSADHGIEKPADRIAAGKPETGTIVLNSYHQGGHIIIEISDDGRGLAIEKIKKKALQNNLVTEQQLAAMSVHQLQQMIFHAGFSTAEKITSVSGRGVGMDVVRTNVEKIGGSIEMTSVEGKGTTFTIKIPLTLAIVSALIVGAGGERFAIPQLSISELVMVNASGANQIETIDDALVLRLRGNILPLVYLSKILGITDDQDPGYGSARYIVVVKVASYDFGIVVDNVFDMEEIVVKPLTSLLKHLQIFSGNTILGDGQVIMILDPAGILKLVGSSEMADASSKLSEHDEEQKRGLADKEKLFLLVKVGSKTPKAVSLEMISRLEEVSVSKIEDSNGSPVIQYNGRLMPVHTFSGALPDKERCPLIIFNHDNRVAGLFADEILDIAKYYGDVSCEGSGGKILDSIIINDHATDVINSEWYTAQGVILEERA